MNNHKALSLPSLYEKVLNDSPQIARTREIVLAHGWNSTSYQLINPGIERWFSKTGDAVVGFVSCSGRRVVAGAPVCAKERLRDVVAEFEQNSLETGRRACYFCAEARLESFYENTPSHAKILLGAQPVWNPNNWTGIVAKNKSLRAQLNRARNKGVTVTEWSIEKAHDNQVLKQCLKEWLSSKGLPPLRFLVEPNTLSRLFDRRVFVATRSKRI